MNIEHTLSTSTSQVTHALLCKHPCLRKAEPEREYCDHDYIVSQLRLDVLSPSLLLSQSLSIQLIKLLAIHLRCLRALHL